jgi:uncharacterized protein (TIGR02217 family)
MTFFHEARLPARLAFGCTGGVERRTDVVTLASGFERRTSAWSAGRRRYLIATAPRPLDEVAELLAFFEARGGRLAGFRFRDPTDWKSCAPSAQPAASDQPLGTGDGTRKVFQLSKIYGETVRAIAKPVAGTVKVAVAGAALAANAFAVDTATGLVTLATAPAAGAIVTAGFEFDTPVRFDLDRLDVTLEGFNAARVTACALVEVRV